MKVWSRRLLIVLFVVFWLILLLLPSLAFVLARNGQVQIGDTDGRYWRLFLLQDTDSEGVGLERAQAVSPPVGSPQNIVCRMTTVAYWMWSGEGPGVSYCQCIDSATGNMTDIVPPACMSID